MNRIHEIPNPMHQAQVADDTATPLPLAGVRVVDFGHTVMGPCCAMMLGDLGADIIKVEPAPSGDPTRNLRGFGAGYFGYFNRNKSSIAINLKSSAGQEAARRLLATADVLVENFGPGTMDRLGLGYEQVREINPRLIYCELKGFMSGPYEHRPALDEVVQMMSGLAYMTGPVGQPLRAGTSVIDIVGGMFGMMGVLLALRERDKTNQGKLIKSTLYESAVFLMGQHLCYASQMDDYIPPMPARTSAWSIYDVFPTQEGSSLFIGITSDKQWARFCTEFELQSLLDRTDLSTNNARIEARAWLLPEISNIISNMPRDAAMQRLEQAGVPFAPVNRPEDLFQDPHLAATANLLDSILPNGKHIRTPRLPLRYGTWESELRAEPPTIGNATSDILSSLGYSADEIDQMRQNHDVR